MSGRKRLLGCFVLLMACTLLSPWDQAQAAYPEKPITIVVPQGAGGGLDGMARALASRLEKALGVPVVVSNEDGAGGRRASIVLFKSAPDGYTIGMPHFAAFLYDDVLGGTKPPIDVKKFSVIMRADTTVFFIHVNKKSPFKTIQDFKTAGRPIKFATAGVGNPSWLAPAALGASVGFRPVFVTGHKSLSEAALAVARGDVDAAAGSYTHFQGVLEDVRPLVYLSDQRSHLMPQIPSIAEAGFPKLASLGVPWVLSAPPGTPNDITNTLRTALTKIATSAEFVAWAQKQGYNPSVQGPDAFWKSLADMEEVYKSIKPMMAEKK